MIKKVLALAILLVSISLLLIFFPKKEDVGIKINPTSIPTKAPVKNIEIVYPVAEFKQRITKKPFGIYITPQTSPVQPERFQGFHTGVDVEYQDVLTDVPVFAVCDGDIVLSRWVSGYGGTVVLKCQKDSTDYYFLYGHLKTDSIRQSPKVQKGEQLAILGKGNTQETDFERKHLHFALHQGSLDLRGYVKTSDELIKWLDPLSKNPYFTL